MASSRFSLYDRVACAVVLAVAAWWGLRTALPTPLDATAPTHIFSAARAMKHVAEIAQRPHPAGSAEAARVRDYIRAELTRLGIDNEIQRGPGLYQRGSWIMAGNAENVVGRIAGKEKGPAIVLSCHYDSVPLGPSAADDGAGVGVVLETARILKSGAQPERDVLLLFDVEETGMTGADAFARSQIWRKARVYAINVEARGTSGPAFMFQTSANNLPLIRTYAEVAPHPIANSLTYEIYRRLPNDTDMSVFRRYGYRGYDFAFIDNVLAYHTPNDDVAHLSPSTVQHEGEAMLALARKFATAPASLLTSIDESKEDATYFSAGGRFFVYANSTASWLLVAMAGALYWLGTTLELRRTSWAARIAALLTPPLLVGVAALSATALWKLLCVIHPDYAAFPQQDLYARDWYIAAIFALAVSLAFVALRLATRWASLELIAFSALTLCGIGAIALAAQGMPGATYFLAWPVVGGIAALFVAKRSAALAALCAIPALWLMLPFARFGFVGLSMRGAALCTAIFATMLVCVLLPVAEAVARRYMRAAYASLIVCLLLLIGGGFANRLDAAHPLENNMNYLYDADTHKASWVSQSTQLDPWLRQFLTATPERVASLYDTGFAVMRHDAPAMELDAPKVEIVADKTERGVRGVDLRIRSQRGALEFLVQVLDGVVEGGVEGLRWTRQTVAADRAGWRGSTLIYYTCPGPDGANLGFRLPADTKLRFRVFEPTQGLPRPAGFFYMGRGPGLLAALARPFSDETIVVKTFEF